ncbi:MAG: universal stress protein [Vicinamibacterales bacterium]
MSTFTRILCPVDLSETSGHAVTLAAALSARSGAQLTLHYVYVPMFVPVPGLPIPGDRIPADEVARVIDEVRIFATAAGGPPGTPVTVDVGHPAAEILARAERDKSDLIVMGTHGASGFTRLVLGSVTEKVLRQAPCPVLTVPPGAPATSHLPFRHIVCAVDFADWSMAALNVAVSLAQESGARITAVHAIEWPWPEPPAPIFSDIPKAQADALFEFRRYTSDRAGSRLADAVRDVVGGRCDADTEVVNGKGHVEVVRAASSRQADLIVIGMHGRSPLDLAIFGSTTNQVVRHAACPVLTVRR